eukprot:TRINITY_DN33940_c0_g1_i1.p1 TRINITY_DN33940_c0_g1~~TRINITY_DN33940_c0_g1_i1.p1  ORF type:complete len:155 (+),score=23.21 TRINITY_DN33940_c0_g1_i1:128-592(+)
MHFQLDTYNTKKAKQLEMLCVILFPIKYPASFFLDAAKEPHLNQLAYYGDNLVGNVICTVDTAQPKSPKIYIRTLGVLPAYRRLGVGKALVSHVIDCIKKKKAHGAQSVYLHVQPSNTNAIEFYRAMGFEETNRVDSYYKDMEEKAAIELTWSK